MCVHVNALPDDCFLIIFDLIPLQELLCLDQVSYRWARLLPSAAVRRHSLVLILGGRQVDHDDLHWNIPLNDTFDLSFNGRRPFYDLSMADREASVTVPFLLPQSITFEEFLLSEDESEGFFDMLYRADGYLEEEDFTERARFNHARLSGQLLAYLVDLLPNVHKLVVIHTQTHEEELFSLIDVLVSSWSLVVLKLWLRTTNRINNKYSDHPNQHPVRTLLQAIAQQSSLQHLTLDMGEDPPEYPAPEDVFNFPTELFAFIGQLKVARLFLDQYDKDDFIWKIVQHYNSAVLSEISFGNYRWQFMEEGPMNPRYTFTAKVGQFYWYNMSFIFVSAEQFDKFCLRYPSLTMLQMDWTSNITFARLLSNLASLRQLTQLELNGRGLPENAFALIDGDKDEEGQVVPISLPQVKVLKLFHCIISRSHHAFEPLSPLVFPSVEVIIFSCSSSCTICNVNIFEDNEAANRCKRMFVRSLRNTFTSPLLRIYAFHGRVHLTDYDDWTELDQA